MRVKIQTTPPLPPLNVWFPVTDILFPTISDFKAALISDLSLFDSDPHLSSTNLSLEIDHFELLDRSSLDVLRDGDLINLKLKAQSSRKRPLVQDDEPPVTSKIRRIEAVVHNSSSSSDSDSDSDSSTTSSSTSSSSSASSSSSSSSAPSPKPIQKVSRSVDPYADFQRSVQSKHLVPPGQGKPSTHERNARRRKRRQLEKLADNPSLANIPQSLTQQQPLPQIPSTSFSSSFITPSISANLHNKNKRKGFKHAMQGKTAQKISFDDQPPENNVSHTLNSMDNFIPPSRRSNLPSNIIVTSVDVEEGLWPTQKSSNKKAMPITAAPVNGEFDSLNYGPSEEQPVVNGSPLLGDDDGALWNTIDSKWDTLTIVEVNSVIVQGILLAWKALDIDPVSLSPQMLLNIAKVVNVNGTDVSVAIIKRPKQGVVAFGGVELEELDDTDDQLEVYDLGEMVKDGWRIAS